MIKINVAEIKKHLTGSKTFQLNVEPAELDITAADLVLTGKVRIEGTLSNVGDVLLLEAQLTAVVQRTCSRCLQEFAAETSASVVEKYYPVGSVGV